MKRQWERLTPNRYRRATEKKIEYRGILLTALISTVGATLISFPLGQYAERRKEVVVEHKQSIDDRVKAFAATTENFSFYNASLFRLRSISAAEDTLRNLGTELDGKIRSSRDGPEKEALLKRRKALEGNFEWIAKRKDAYVTRRDDARDKLGATFEQARLVFAGGVIAKIDEFDKFDASQGNLPKEQMAPNSAWREYFVTISHSMRDEVKGEQEKKRASWCFIWMPDCE